MITIKLRPGQDPNRAFQKLKNTLINEGLFLELKKRKYFVDASTKRRLKSEDASKQRAKDLHRAAENAEQEWRC
jgi:ribosomal protein S21